MLKPTHEQFKQMADNTKVFCDRLAIANFTKWQFVEYTDTRAGKNPPPHFAIQYGNGHISLLLVIEDKKIAGVEKYKIKVLFFEGASKPPVRVKHDYDNTYVSLEKVLGLFGSESILPDRVLDLGRVCAREKFKGKLNAHAVDALRCYPMPIPTK